MKAIKNLPKYWKIVAKIALNENLMRKFKGRINKTQLM